MIIKQVRCAVISDKQSIMVNKFLFFGFKKSWEIHKKIARFFIMKNRAILYLKFI
jgi:hypothetical protein